MTKQRKLQDLKVGDLVCRDYFDSVKFLQIIKVTKSYIYLRGNEKYNRKTGESIPQEARQPIRVPTKKDLKIQAKTHFCNTVDRIESKLNIHRLPINICRKYQNILDDLLDELRQI